MRLPSLCVLSCVVVLACGDKDPHPVDGQAEIAPNSCAVIGSTRVSGAGPGIEIARLRGGFAVGPAFGPPAWSFSLPGGASQIAITPSAPTVCTIPVVDDDVRPALIVASYAGTTNTLDSVQTQVWRGTPPASGPVQTVGEAYRRGTSVHGCVPSFDGERAVLTAAHVAVDVPEAIMLGRDGARIGQAASLGLAEPRFGCLAVTPTEHGAAVSARADDADTGTLHVVELGRDGAVLQNIAYALPRTAECPRLVASTDGMLAALSLADGSFRVLKLSGGQVRELPAPSPASTPQWLQETDDGLLWLDTTDQKLRMQHVSASGQTRTLAGELGALDTVVAGEAGRLFVARPGSENELTIEEIACRTGASP